ncbi:FAD-binding oxidoreductase [Streptomyces sp. VRA16 Mangrove soil]|uniref:FAD-binding oxidoreductase n=1 Tax=Streptomyces sp. VRA16 Mangrove soil TaxID=2817434 RepID=UPI001A9EB02E|nr:FAD-dependent oxidoreductase [Streptomyces sp. VRA16 Mangrove soil]MBO1333989.1 FAD-binding protein [Streptomyces sp. VRA16 Mangrove soil]
MTTYEDVHDPHHTRTLRPDDPGYDDELAGFQTGFTQRPDVIFAAAGADDVVAAVAYAADAGLPVGVQATGHGLPDSSTGGVLITTRRMAEVHVDPAARTVRVGAGATWGAVAQAAAPHGLAPLNGSAPSVGVVGYTLGGGLGILAREFGYTADHVRAVDVVTADATLRRVTADSDPELFRGLLGGGAQFGVVTALEVDLVPVARLYGGSLGHDGRVTDVADIVRAYTAWAATVPDTLTSSLAALVYPDAPAMPPRLRGQYVVSVRIAFTGTAEEGERLVAPLRAALGTPVTDTVREMPYGDSHTIHADPDFAHPYYGDSVFLDEMDADAVAELFTLCGPAADGMHIVQLNHLGGALSRPAPNAVPYRSAGWLVRVLSPLGEGGRDAARAHHARAFGAVADQVVGRSLNFAFGGGDRTEGLYDPDTRKRLAELKAAYDPANLFRRNYTVK